MSKDTSTNTVQPTRRDFVKGAGISFAVAATAGSQIFSAPANAQSAGAPGTGSSVAPNIWVTIGTDDVITIQYGGTEWGRER